MLDRGLKAGDRVVIFARTCPEYLEIYVGLQLAGLVAVPANFRLTGHELGYILENSGARGVIIGEEFLPLLDAERDRLGIRHDAVIVLGRRGEHRHAYETLLAAATGGELPAAGSLASAGAIFYTSGTTGFPKGAALSQLTLLIRFCSWGWGFGISEQDVVLVPGPVFHQSFSAVAIIALCVGAKVVLKNEFEGGAVLDAIARHGVTWSFMVPKMLAEIVETIERGGRGPAGDSVRGLLSSGSTLPRPVFTGLEEGFPRARISDAYGWTESGWITLCSHEDLVRKERSVGRASFGCELVILDDEGRELGPGEVGRIYAANPVQFLGYHGNPEATAAMRRGKWETGGDVGTVDDDGHLTILDRERDIIISGGENVYPAEIERVLADHPKILEVAVVGVPDARWGESPRACVVPRDGEEMTDEDVLGFCVGRLARFKHPRSVVQLDALPRNSMGKVLRRDLRQRFWNEQGGEVR